MNIFVLNASPALAAMDQCDKHVVKMCLETTQILSTNHCLLTGEQLYKPTHQNHPCTVWARESYLNHTWLIDHGAALFTEYTLRYGRQHKSMEVFNKVTRDTSYFSNYAMTPFAQAMPDQYRNQDAVTAYRNYYAGDKAYMASWARARQPEWWPKEVA